MMRALAVGLLLSSTPAEPRLLPVGATSVRLLEGSARLIPDGGEVADAHLTLLPEGVFFTREGYDRLVGVTTRLQEDLGSIRTRLHDYEAASIAPPPAVAAPTLRGGWSTSDVLVAVLAGVVVGAGGVLLLQATRAP